MGRLIFFALLAVLVFWAIRNHLRKIKKRDEAPPAAGEDMVCCAHCNVHLPKSESITSQDKFFCSEEHRRLHLEAQ